MVLTKAQRVTSGFLLSVAVFSPPKTSHSLLLTSVLFVLIPSTLGLEKKINSKAHMHTCAHTQMGLRSVLMWKTNKATVKRNDLTPSLERS